MNNLIEAFIFDLDGVLAETSDCHFQAWKALVKKLGIELEDRVNEQLKGISRLESLNVILREYGRLSDFNEEEKLALMTEKNNHYIRLISKFNKDNLLPGVYELLVLLRERGIKTAVASASRSASMLISNMEIEVLVDYVVDPSTVKGKPDPGIFLEAAKGLNVSPKHCVGVEDAVAGITAIKAAGMVAIGIGDAAILTGADIIYASPKDLLEQFVPSMNI